MKTNVVENLMYIILAALILGQCVIGVSFYIGQGIYLFANGVSIFRDFYLGRAKADKVKDIACFAITLGLIIFRYLLS